VRPPQPPEHIYRNSLTPSLSDWACERAHTRLCFYVFDFMKPAFLLAVQLFALRFAITSLAVCSLAVSTFAADGNPLGLPPFSADAAALYQRVSQVPAPAGADALILEYQESLIFDSEGKTVRTRYFLYKVLTPRGAQGWADISVRWEPWREERPTLRARVITPDGAEHLLDEKTITDAPAKEDQDSVFSDQRVIRAPLPAIAPGSLVEEELTSKASAPFAGAGVVERFYFGSSVPIQHARLVLDAPSALPIHYEIRLLDDLQPQRSETNGRTRIIFDHGPIDAIEDVASDLPSDVPAYPSVTFSTGSSWRQVAEEYAKIIDKQLATANLKPQVADLVAGKKSLAEKLASILQFVDREVRYTGVEFDDAAVIPRSPSDTLARRYGDCKDKAALLVALLRAAGIHAYVALLNAGSREDVAPGLPGMGMFDHAIVYVPGPSDLWIDVTDEYARLGEMPIADQGRLALIAQTGTEALVRIPDVSSADNLLVEQREIDLAEDGPARVVEVSQPHGSDESSYRRHYADPENKQEREGLSNYVKSQYLAEKLDRVDRSDPADLSKPFELTLESDRARRGYTYLKGAVVAIRLEGLFSRLPSALQRRREEEDSKAERAGKSKKKRTVDYQLPEAFVTEWQYKIVPPAGFQPKPLPHNASLALGPAILTEQFAVADDKSVHAVLRFDTVKRRMTVAEATEMRNQIAQLKEGAPIVIYFEPIGETLLNQGKIREALQSYRDLIALHPNVAVHHLRLAATLLDAGMGETARAEAQAAVKLEPKSSLAEKTLAEILEHDVVGRKFRPGSDYAGAEAAFRAAERLDPDNKQTVGDLAILLEFNRWGLRYGPGARLDDAIAEYRKLSPQELSDLGLQNNLTFALLYAGHFAEAEKYAETLNPQPTALIVACEAALNGSPAALLEARKRTSGEEGFKQIVKAAGDMLVNLRKYALGADLEEAGATGDNASETAAYAILYRKTVPHEQLQFKDDPVGVALHFALLEEDPDLTLDQLRSICSRNGLADLGTLEVFEQIVKKRRRSAIDDAREGTSVDLGMDLALARAQPKVEAGSDQAGYKVVLWASADYKKVIYIVKEGGHYKVLATAPYTEAIGLEVLDRVAANDLENARVLLDWLREDQHLPSGDDPFHVFPFPRFWTRGENADARTIRLAAASLLVAWPQTAARGVAILEAENDSPSSEAEKMNILFALSYGYSNLDDDAKSFDAIAAVAKQHPESSYLFDIEVHDLRAIGRNDEASRIVDEWLRRLPGDVDVMRNQAYVAESRGDYSRAHVMYQEIRDEGKAEASDLNSLAWASLFTGKVEPSDVDAALKAAQLSGKNPRMLHTLGCVYAAAGKTKEAREVLVQGMDGSNLDEPDDGYWYAFGRIAEQYGERDTAIADYARVKKPKDPVEVPISSYRLATMRLQALQAQKP
jgi:transglutaminase-like putative cysteine protease/tetratricopeptide (TPR) repeat protein